MVVLILFFKRYISFIQKDSRFYDIVIFRDDIVIFIEMYNDFS